MVTLLISREGRGGGAFLEEEPVFLFADSFPLVEVESSVKTESILVRSPCPFTDFSFPGIGIRRTSASLVDS